MKKQPKKTNFLLLIAISFLSVFSYAQTSTINEFLKEANFLKEGKMSGYYRNSDNSGDYNIYSSEFNFQIVKVVKENGNVVSFDIDFEAKPTMTMKPSDPVSPIFWTCTNSDFWYVICYKEHLILLNDHPAKNPNYSIKRWFKYNLGMKERINAGINASQGKIQPPFSKEEIDTFLKPFVGARNNMKDAEAAAAKKAADDHYAKFGIKGKEVVKIEIQAETGAKFGFGSNLKYGIVATLKDGTVIKTKNIGGEGYESDYDIKLDGLLEDSYSSSSPLKVSTKPYKYLGDYFKISATSKHHTTIKTEKKIIFTYDQPVKLDFSGLNSTGRGNDGTSVRIDVKPVKHSENGQEVLEYKIYDAEGNLIHSLRLKRDVLLTVISNGGKGGDETNNSKNVNKLADDGGDGGSITLNLDLKVGDNYQFEYTNIGGKGGKNAANSLNNGKDGRDGRFTKNVKSIN